MSKHFYQISNCYNMLRHPEKYKGSLPITTRSSWESAYIFKYLDINENILEWSSESVIVPYMLPTDGKMHRYYMDFWMKCKLKNGIIKEFWIEIKPYKNSIAPVKPKRVTKGTVREVQDWIKNSAKWDATRRIIKEKQLLGENIEFIILTEKDLKGII